MKYPVGIVYTLYKSWYIIKNMSTRENIISSNTLMNLIDVPSMFISSNLSRTTDKITSAEKMFQNDNESVWRYRPDSKTKLKEEDGKTKKESLICCSQSRKRYKAQCFSNLLKPLISYSVQDDKTKMWDNSWVIWSENHGFISWDQQVVKYEAARSRHED